MPYVICFDGPNVNAEWVVGEHTVTIGRDRENIISLHDTKASRKHGKIFKQSNVYFLEDLGSVNGILLHGKKIAAATPIELDTLFQIGQSVLYFSHLSLGELLTKQFAGSGAAFDRTDAFHKLRAQILKGVATKHSGQGGLTEMLHIGGLFGGKKEKPKARDANPPPPTKFNIG